MLYPSLSLELAGLCGFPFSSHWLEGHMALGSGLCRGMSTVPSVQLERCPWSMASCLQQEDVVIEYFGRQKEPGSGISCRGLDPSPFFLGEISCIPGWSSTHVTEDDHELLILSCFHISSARMTGMQHHSQLSQLWESNPGPHTC